MGDAPNRSDHDRDRKREVAIARFLSLDQALDCSEGQRLGCCSFCCSLIVRLRPGEYDPTRPEAQKRCIDKDPDSGVCIHLSCNDGRCRIYRQRPSICREYDCRSDPLLRVVLVDGFEGLVKLVTSPRLKE
jgi:uncharacterized protein